MENTYLISLQGVEVSYPGTTMAPGDATSLSTTCACTFGLGVSLSGRAKLWQVHTPAADPRRAVSHTGYGAGRGATR